MHHEQDGGNVYVQDADHESVIGCADPRPGGSSRAGLSAGPPRDDRPGERFTVSAADRATLRRWLRAPTTPQRTALRSRIVLMLSDGVSARQVARELAVSRHTVALWRRRYEEGGCDALTRDRPGRGRKPGR